MIIYTRCLGVDMVNCSQIKPHKIRLFDPQILSDLQHQTAIAHEGVQKIPQNWIYTPFGMYCRCSEFIMQF
jgi:hypothetical protein